MKVTRDPRCRKGEMTPTPRPYCSPFGSAENGWYNMHVIGTLDHHGTPPTKQCHGKVSKARTKERSDNNESSQAVM